MIDRYQYVNFLFCNAGILSALGLRWKDLILLFFKDPVGLIEKSDATLQATGEINEDGIGSVFAANVFGHYIMVCCRCKCKKMFPVVISDTYSYALYVLRHANWKAPWMHQAMVELFGRALLLLKRTVLTLMTGRASKGKLSSCKEGSESLWFFKASVASLLPYESSKWACDLVAIASNDRYHEHKLHISSYTTSPGVVASSIGNLPLWITKLRTLIHYVVCSPSIPSHA